MSPAQTALAFWAVGVHSGPSSDGLETSRYVFESSQIHDWRLNQQKLMVLPFQRPEAPVQVGVGRAVLPLKLGGESFVASS